jgi:NitT/TauT family transport system permease protein
MRRSLFPAATFLAVLLVWEFVTRSGRIADYIVPPPSDILRELARSANILATHTFATGVEILAGFVVALITGVSLGLALVYAPRVGESLYPWLVVIRVIPKVAIGPLFVMWFGFGLVRRW